MSGRLRLSGGVYVTNAAGVCVRTVQYWRRGSMHIMSRGTVRFDDGSVKCDMQRAVYSRVLLSGRIDVGDSDSVSLGAVQSGRLELVYTV